MDWTPEVISRLRGFWADGHSTAEIGRRLGVSKNAVVGKAHRLDLPARPSPIRRDGIQSPAARRPSCRVAGPTLPPLSSNDAPPASAPVMTGAPTEVPVEAPLKARVEAARQTISAPVSRPVPRAVETPAPRQSGSRPFARMLACCWPIGEPGTKSFRFCDEGATAGKPYCAAHAALAYVRVRDRREDAA